MCKSLCRLLVIVFVKREGINIGIDDRNSGYNFLLDDPKSKTKCIGINFGRRNFQNLRKNIFDNTTDKGKNGPFR